MRANMIRKEDEKEQGGVEGNVKKSVWREYFVRACRKNISRKVFLTLARAFREELKASELKLLRTARPSARPPPARPPVH